MARWVAPLVAAASAGLIGAGRSRAPRQVDDGGLLQRAAVTSGFAWLTAAHIRALRDR
jgi:hypothetical protein